MAPVLVLCLVLLVCWNLTGATGHTESTMAELDVMLPGETIEVPEPKIMEIPGETTEVPSESLELPGGRVITLAPDVIVKREIIGHVTGSESHIAVTQIRILFSAMFAVIGLIGAVVACLTRRRRDVAIFVLAMALAPLILIFIPYGGRLVNYLFVFLLAPMAYFGARLLDMRKRAIVLIFCLFLVVSLPLHLIAHYGNQAFEYYPQTQVSGLRFSYAQTTNDHIITSDYAWAMEGEISGVDYPFISLSQLQWQDHRVLPKGGFQDSPYWTYIMRRDEEGYNFLLGDSSFIQKIEDALDNSINCDLVYYNPDFKLYFLEPF